MEAPISTKAPELHLLVLWEKARAQQQRILEDLRQNLTILQAYEIHWTPERVASNFSRFYGVKLGSHSFKEKECGGGPFLLLVVRDEKPQYTCVETSRGHETVNITLFDLKTKYRAWTQGNSKIHATNSPEETNHDAALMLGKNYADLEASLPEAWDGNIISLHRDITGAGGWADFSELFYTLNATINYVVMRNEEVLPEQFRSAEHGDIDLLTDDAPNLALLTEAVPAFPEPYRVHHMVRVAGQDIAFAIRYVGDDFYCRPFEESILEHRELNAKGIYTPDAEHAFYGLVYHALIHHRSSAAEYLGKARLAYERLGTADAEDAAAYAGDFDRYFALLKRYMKEKGYPFVRPQDKSVYYAEKIVQEPDTTRRLQRALAVCRVRSLRPVHLEATAAAYNMFYYGENAEGQGLFIKCGTEPGLYSNEYRSGKTLWELDPVHFVRPLCYRDFSPICFCVSERTEGISLREAVENGCMSDECRRSVIRQLGEIHRALRQTSLVHRDIRPENLLLCGETLKLIDFQLAIDSKRFIEPEMLRRTPLMNYYLGAGFNPAPCEWDDSYSLLRVLEFIGRPEGDAELYDAVHAELSAAVGSGRFEHPGKENIKQMLYRIEHPRPLLVSLFRSFRHLFYHRKTGGDGKRRTYLFGICIRTR